MNAQKLAVKLLLQDPSQAHGLKLLPVFQQWIQFHAMDEHLLIDVADYDHVPDGPGTVLVSHEANLYLDHIGGRPGLLYQRKQPLPGPFADRLAAVVRYTLQAAGRLEEHPGLKFRTDELSFRIADRLRAPNTAETFDAVRLDLEAFTLKLYGPRGTFDIQRTSAPDRLFEVTIKSSTSPSITELLANFPLAAAV